MPSKPKTAAKKTTAAKKPKTTAPKAAKKVTPKQMEVLRKAFMKKLAKVPYEAWNTYFTKDVYKCFPKELQAKFKKAAERIDAKVYIRLPEIRAIFESLIKTK